MLAAAAAVLGVVTLLSGPTPRHPRPAPRPAPRPPAVVAPHLQAEVTVLPAAAPLPISSAFLGLSTEYWSLPIDAGHLGQYERVLQSIHVPRAAPLTLRIGGNSSDHALWEPPSPDMPSWAFSLSPEWLSDTAEIVRENHLRVVIDLNFITGTPEMAADWALAAEHEFPPGSIVGFEIGNEPDLYDRALWAEGINGTPTSLGVLPEAITPHDYARGYRAYARALAAVALRAALFGPAIALPRIGRAWIAHLLSGAHPRLRAVTVHDYPYDACAPVGSARHPTIAKLLSPQSTAQMAAAIAPDARLAHAARLPLVLTEFNSVTCGGLPGVSNTFATALWAPDALFTLARAGAAAADLHVRAFSANAPFRFHRAGVFVRPLLYGLVLFTRMLGPDAHLVGVRVRAPSQANLAVWAVTHATHRVAVLLLNRGRRSLTVRIRLPRRMSAASAAATVQRLLARSARSTVGVTLAGQHIGWSGRWVGPRVVESITPHHGSYEVFLRGMSGALVAFPLPPGARSARTASRGDAAASAGSHAGRSAP